MSYKSADLTFIGLKNVERVQQRMLIKQLGMKRS